MTPTTFEPSALRIEPRGAGSFWSSCTRWPSTAIVAKTAQSDGVVIYRAEQDADTLFKVVPASYPEAVSRDAVRLLARIGYSAKGAVYALVGALALKAARRWSRPAGSDEALQVLNHPLLLAIGLGLVAFSLWRLVQTVLDPDEAGQFRRLLGHRFNGWRE